MAVARGATTPASPKPALRIDVTVQPAHPDQAFALISGRVDGSYLVWLARSDDNGATFTEIEPPLPSDFVATTVEVAPTNPLRVYVSGKITSTQQGAIQRSDDGGVTWTASLLDVHGSTSIYIGAVDPLDADVIYIRTLSDVASRVIASRDAGATWKDVWSAQGDVPGMALSADGSTMALGGPMAGINIASTADWAFRQTSSVGAYCLSWLGNDLLACGKEAVDGFSIGVSHDEGAHFSPLLHLSDIVPRPCPSGSSAGGCATAWGPMRSFKSASMRGRMARCPQAHNPELNPVGDERPARGCSCRMGETSVPRFDAASGASIGGRALAPVLETGSEQSCRTRGVKTLAFAACLAARVPLNGNIPRTILLVDDDHDVAEALSTVLADEGYDVATASNGREALVYLKSHTAPRLILLDVMMPVMDGYEFRIEQQRDPAIADIPVVVLTAGSMGERVAEMGVTAHMRKPVDLDRLLSEVAHRTDLSPISAAPQTLRAY